MTPPERKRRPGGGGAAKITGNTNAANDSAMHAPTQVRRARKLALEARKLARSVSGSDESLEPHQIGRQPDWLAEGVELLCNAVVALAGARRRTRR
jgi:hypothetical protein